MRLSPFWPAPATLLLPRKSLLWVWGVCSLFMALLQYTWKHTRSFTLFVFTPNGVILHVLLHRSPFSSPAGAWCWYTWLWATSVTCPFQPQRRSVVLAHLCFSIVGSERRHWGWLGLFLVARYWQISLPLIMFLFTPQPVGPGYPLTKTAPDTLSFCVWWGRMVPHCDFSSLVTKGVKHIIFFSIWMPKCSNIIYWIIYSFSAE